MPRAKARDIDERRAGRALGQRLLRIAEMLERDERRRQRLGERVPGRRCDDGKPRGFRLAAAYADEFNLTSSSPERTAERYALLDATLREAGRDPKTLVHSAMVGTMIGRDDTEVRRRGGDLAKAFGMAPTQADEVIDGRRARWIVGTPDDARAMARRYADAGVERLMLQDFLPWDLDMVDLMAEALIGQI